MKRSDEKERSGFEVLRGMGMRWAAVMMCAGVMAAANSAPAANVTTAFIYQGFLEFSGAPANGSFDMAFGLFAEPSGGMAMHSTEGVVGVVDGVFTQSLDFGDVFNGQMYYLEIGARPNGSADPYSILVPRQPLAAAPYALSLRPGATITGSGQTMVYGIQTGFGGNSSAIRGQAGDAPSGLGPGSSAGVWGDASGQNFTGVHGSSDESYGIVGRTATGDAAILGRNSNTFFGLNTGQQAGVMGMVTGANTFGVLGASQGEAGVKGLCTNALGYGGYFINSSTNGVGLYVEGSGSGFAKAALRAYNSEATGGIAAYINNASTFATAHFANAGTGEVLWLQNGGTNTAGASGGDFIRCVNNPQLDTQFRVDTAGNVTADGTFSSPAADFAEMLPGAADLEPGDVLAIGADGKLVKSSAAMQRTVVGVHSTRPAFLGGRPVEGARAGDVPLAVMGIVPVKATAEGGAIAPGDLLVSSSTPGHAMKAPAAPPAGSVIGKALTELGGDAGAGQITMLVMPQ